MKRLAIATLLVVSATAFIGGCGSGDASSADEAKLHSELAKPPNGRNLKGPGQKKAEAATSTGTTPTAGGTTTG